MAAFFCFTASLRDGYKVIDSTKSWAGAKTISTRAGKEPAHELSDYDVVLFSHAPKAYLKDDTWLSAFRTPWVVVREKIKTFRKTFHTRLVIFEVSSISIRPHSQSFSSEDD